MKARRKGVLGLRQKQELFAALAADLILRVFERPGYTCTLGEVARSKEEAERLARLGVGIVNSLHRSRLAIDINLFRFGVYQTKTEQYRWLGEWWKQQHSLCRWGGDFPHPKVDGNHFSVSHGGRA